MSDPRHPIGPWSPAPDTGTERVARWIDEIEAAPAALRQAVAGLSADMLEIPYRDGGWTIRQVAHHLPDSHVNAYVRTRLALTEDAPVIKGYEEDRWAELSDARLAPVDVSLALLTALHERWVRLLRSLGPADLARTFVYPNGGRVMSIAQQLDLYAWHGRHHVAQITTLRAARGA